MVEFVQKNQALSFRVPRLKIYDLLVIQLDI